VATVNGSVTPATSSLFRLRVCDAGTYTFTFCSGGGTATYDTWLCLYDGCFNLFAANDDNCGALSELAVALPRGDYYIAVSGFADSAGDYTLAYSANVRNNCPASCEDRLLAPGGSITPAELAATVSGAVTPTQAVNYEVTADAPGDYTFSFCIGGTADYDTALCLYDCNFNLIARNDDSCGDLSQIRAGLDAGRYNLAVSGFGGLGGAAGNYTLAYYRTVMAPVTCNGRTLTSGGVIRPKILRPQAVTGSVTSTSGTYYTFNVTNPGIFGFSFCGGDVICAGAGYDTLLCLYDEGWTEIAENDDDCGVLSMIRLTLNPGVYHIAVSGFAGESGDYRLGYYLDDATCNGRVLQYVNTIQPAPAFATIAGSVAPTGGESYRVIACQMGFYTFSFCAFGGGAAYDTWLCLLDAEGGLLTEVDDTCGVLSQLGPILLAPGEYFLGVSGFGAESGAYTLAYGADIANNCKTCNGRPLSTGSAIHPTPQAKTIRGFLGATDGNHYDFELCSTARCTFTFCSGGASADFDTVLCLQDNCGNSLVENDDACGLLSEIDAVLPLVVQSRLLRRRLLDISRPADNTQYWL
jgi:hypothetical protein